MTLKLIWLTDLHLLPDGGRLSGYDTMSRLDRAVGYIKQHQTDADFCVISGDLTDLGEAACYQYLHNVLTSLPMPYLPLAGNHDLRRELTKLLAVPESSCSPYVQYAIKKNGNRIIALDTLCEGQSQGTLCDQRLEWLEDELVRDQDSPTIVFCHHPPDVVHLPPLDTSRLAEGDRLLALLSHHPNVKHLCFGHVHRPMSGSFGNLGFTALRSTTMQAPLPYPDWDWSNFNPVQEAPDIGIIRFSDTSVVIQQHPFCQAMDDYAD